MLASTDGYVGNSSRFYFELLTGNIKITPTIAETFNFILAILIFE